MTNMKQTVISNPSWWRRRTGLERVLTLTTACGVLAVLALVTSLCVILLDGKTRHAPAGEPMPMAAASVGDGFPPEGNLKEKTLCSTKTKYDETPDVCMTPGCIKAANRIIQAMDRNIEPCDDFYRFACGSFLKDTVIPDDKVSVNTFSVIGDKLQLQLRGIVESPIDRENEPEPFTVAKDLYKSCMNKSLIEKRGYTPLLEAHKRLGGWPVLDGPSWDESKWSWDKSVKQFRQNGYSMDYFIDFSISTDFKNSTKRVIDLDQAILGLSREYLVKGFSDRIVIAYYEYMTDLAVMLGAPRDRAEKELKESLQFEMNLANISLPTEKRRNATVLYNPHTIAELQEKFPLVQWLDYINVLLPEGLKVTENEVVVVNVPSYLTKLEKLLKETPKRVQANYALWRVTAFSIFFLTDDLRKRQLQYATALSGRTEQESRWKECVDLTSGR
ncbi:neprilysin-2-like [Ctenocephalides felis]|uniref:neprilysin-2-like n=1 Tax=Ctenocephalides felis TaxID=7515 RepID=UPI000E6E1148|nr:neprilysin-2-like [Ctenocephalides felis]